MVRARACTTSTPRPAPRQWGFGYGTTKTGMIEIAAMLASQFGDRGIRAFSVQPGTVLTEQLASAMGTGRSTPTCGTPPRCGADHPLAGDRARGGGVNGALICTPSFVRDRRLHPAAS